MKYQLRAVRGNELKRIEFEAQDDRHALQRTMDVYHNFAPSTDVWLLGKVVTVSEDGRILHTFNHCDSCDRIVCDEDCSNYEY